MPGAVGDGAEEGQRVRSQVPARERGAFFHVERPEPDIVSHGDRTEDVAVVSSGRDHVTRAQVEACKTALRYIHDDQERITDRCGA